MEKKQIRNLVLMGLLLLLCIGGYMGLKNYNDKEAGENGETAEEESLKLGRLEREDIVRLSWMAEGENCSAEKVDGVWYSGSVSLNAAEMTSSTMTLANLTAAREISGEEVDLEAFGINSPSNIITAETDKGESQTITIGVMNPVTNEYYACVDGDLTKVYLIGSTLALDFQKKPEDLAQEP